MQKLHLVGFTTDLDGLIFSARKGSKAGGYMVPLDKALLATIAEAERMRNGDTGGKGDAAGGRARARPDSRLTPREIQAQLRAGRSIPEVASQAGVETDWVERFAVPVVAEQAQMVERARRLTYSKTRLGQSTQPLGTSVRWNLADKGVALTEDAFEQGWNAFQLHDDVWMIRFQYTSRARLQVAEWELDLDAGQLHSRNRLASELGYVEKGRRAPALPAPSGRQPAAPPMRVSEEGVEEPSEPDERPAPVTRRRRATKRRPPARRPTKKRPTARKSSAKKRPPARRSASAPSKRTAANKKKSPPKTTATRKTTATKRAATKRAAKKRATTRPAPKRTAVTKRSPERRPEAKKIATRPVTRNTTASSGGARKATSIPTKKPVSRAVSSARKAKTQRPRIVGVRARDSVATKRSGHAAVRRSQAAKSRPRRTPARAEEPTAGPAMSGPLARSLLARRLIARKAAEGDGNSKPRRPLRVR